MSTERDIVLAAIRASLGGASRRASEASGNERAYRCVGTLNDEARLSLFEESLREYGVVVFRALPDEMPAVIADRLSTHGASRIAIPAGLAAEWLPNGFNFVLADDLAAPELDLMDGVLTACTVAIAETGSIVLQSGLGHGPRRLSLVPDYHLSVVRHDQVVETVPEAMARLRATATLPTTFISGPSATSDIEMTRVRGVHGPRMLEVILSYS